MGELWESFGALGQLWLNQKFLLPASLGALTGMQTLDLGECAGLRGESFFPVRVNAPENRTSDFLGLGS